MIPPNHDATDESLADPSALRDRPDVAEAIEERTVSAEKHEALRERYAQIDGVAQVGVRRADGAVLLARTDRSEEWAPPGGNVALGQDWVAAATTAAESLTGEAVVVDDPVLYGRTTFVPDDGEGEGVSAETVVFAASLADPETGFAEDPTLPEDLDHPLYGDGESVGLELAWFESVPADVNPNHREEIELLLE
jgi:hypothetical protein